MLAITVPSENHSTVHEVDHESPSKWSQLRCAGHEGNPTSALTPSPPRQSFTCYAAASELATRDRTLVTLRRRRRGSVAGPGLLGEPVDPTSDA
eukprot:768269-Hanusia_phi.AAC.6